MISKLPMTSKGVSCIEIKKGEEISFAHYFQPDTNIQFAYDIDWMVLEEKNRAVLLVSKKGLYCKALDINNKNCWETSSLREWLNTEWVKESFSYGLENMIVPTSCASPLDVKSLVPYHLPEKGFRPKKDSEDYVFLLSNDEVINKINYREVELEAHWMASKSKNEDDESEIEEDESEIEEFARGVKWWTRPTGDSDENIINEYGEPSFCEPSASDVFVRPAVWIDNFYIHRCYMDALALWKKQVSNIKKNIFDYEEFRKAASAAHSILYLYSKWSDMVVSYPKLVVEMLLLIAKYSEIRITNESSEYLLSINAAEALCRQSIHWNTIYKYKPKPGEPGALKNGFVIPGLNGESIVVDASTFDLLNPLDKKKLSQDGFFTM